jgi:hypothetical protein
MNDKAPSPTRSLSIVIVLVLIAGGAVAFALLRPREPGLADKAAQAVLETPPGKAVKKSLALTDAEREAYVQSGKIEIRDLKIDPDTTPTDGGPVQFVKGLLRVSGQVANVGDKSVDSAKLTITTYDDQNKVLGVYVEDVVKQMPGVLGPGEVRPFKWQIPDKKGFSGHFEHALR